MRLSVSPDIRVRPRVEAACATERQNTRPQNDAHSLCDAPKTAQTLSWGEHGIFFSMNRRKKSQAESEHAFFDTAKGETGGTYRNTVGSSATSCLPRNLNKCATHENTASSCSGWRASISSKSRANTRGSMG